MNANSKSPGNQNRDALRKLYSKPQILKYGTIHEITHALGMGARDGIETNKTSKG